MDNTTPLLCEGPCNPQHSSVMAQAAAVRSTLDSGEPMSGPAVLGLRSLIYTPHRWTRTDHGWRSAVDLFACTACGTERVYGRREPAV